MRQFSQDKDKIPFLIWLVIGVSLVSCLFDDIVIVFRVSGWAWFLPLGVSFIFLFRNGFRSPFPIRIWMPWILLVGVYLAVSYNENALQRTIMLLCPLAVGMAVSLQSVSEKMLTAIYKRFHNVAIVFTLFALMKMGVLVTGALPTTSGLAPQSMTAALMATLFATGYAAGQRRGLVSWLQMMAIPVVALTRTAMVATSLSLPLTLAPLRIYKRVLVLGLIALGGLGLFFTERVQRKMFYSGSGTLEEVRIDNPDFRTSGRSVMWENLWYQVGKEPWLGHGANAQEAFLSRRYGGVTHPHNDWLRLLYDYGYVGTGVFALCLILQAVHLWRMSRLTRGMTRQFFQASFSAWVPFLIFMVTDNIILYAAFFGNLHFALIGLAYGALARQRAEAQTYVVLPDVQPQTMPSRRAAWRRP